VVSIPFFQLADLTDKEMKYESARTELDALYHQIFDGPTEGEHLALMDLSFRID